MWRLSHVYCCRGQSGPSSLFLIYWLGHHVPFWFKGARVRLLVRWLPAAARSLRRSWPRNHVRSSWRDTTG